VQAESKRNSVLEAALLAEAPKQWERFQQNKAKRAKGLPKWKRELEDIAGKVADAKAHAEELRRRYDPELMRINANLARKLGITGGLRCPKCGESDRHNTMNGKPWCMKCNVALESPFLVKKRLPDMKVLSKTKRQDVTFRGLDE
jgi:formylmethanofuran dehydrogenase subunit E